MTTGRLLVQHGSGTISTCDPDGSRNAVVAVGTPDRLQHQPTWSPDATRVAFSCLTRSDGLRAVVAVADPDGGDRIETLVPAPPFYFLWRPDGRAVAGLSVGPVGFDLTLVEPGAGAETLGRGAPFFFDWARDGSALVAHIDTMRLVVAHGTDHRPLGPDPGTFTTPAWLGAGVVAAVADGGSEQVVVIDPAGVAAVRTLCRYDGYARFVPSPDGLRLAFVCGRRENQPPAPPSVLADTGWAIPSAFCVLDLESEELDVVWSAPPVAFSWSPDGRLLLLLVRDDDQEDAALRWMVWDGGLEMIRLSGMVPTAATARNYLPFAEQYARSQTWWSPDSAAICWAARDSAGADRVWVQELDGQPRAVSEGTVVSWSPA